MVTIGAHDKQRAPEAGSGLVTTLCIRIRARHLLQTDTSKVVCTEGGKAYERREFETMIKGAGFKTVRFTPVGPVSTLIVGQK